MANASNVFRVGDYVYVETNPALPYQIRRIEELTKTSNGQVEAKVQCFYRKRDLSSALAVQAEKHLIQAEEDAEIEMGDNEMEDVLRHQLIHREVFLSRQYENINANTIRGKCLVTLYNEAEVLPKYLEKEDWFHYFLVYDPQQKTLVADRGEMGIGTAYQAQVPKTARKGLQDDRDLSKLETLVWNPKNSLQDQHIDQFLVIARSVGTFARALDCSSSVKQPSLHMSAAAASRDITLSHAMCALHNNGYNVSKAIASLVPSGGPILCRDEMEEWSAGEATLFEEALQKYGKDFADIQKDFLPWKSLPSIVEYYYMWKTTDRYLQQKRLKAVSKECNLTQIYIPGLGGSTSQSGKKQTSTIILTPPPGVATNLIGVTCESCYGTSSQQWYPWGVPNSQHKFWLCTLCWIYWKKYGGLKRPDGLSGKGHGGLQPSYTCRVCGKVFNRAERLSSHMGTHKVYKCGVSRCEKVFNSRPNLTRHLTAVHGCRPPSPRKLKPRSPFYIRALPLTKLARRLCQDLYNKVHHCRVVGEALNIQEIRAQCLKRLETPKAEAIIKAKKRRVERKLHDVVDKIKANPPKPHKPPKPSKPTLLPLPKEHSPTSPSPPTPTGHSITSPSRKMIPPSKSYVPIQPTPPKASDWKYAAIPSAKPVVQSQQTSQQTTNHMMARKRSHESGSVQQNGIDGPSAKRLSATSPLGKKGCECTYCGKILHNQASLTHHEQTMHASAEPPKQRSYPAYCDVSPALGPGSTKIVPYAQHSVTSYINGQLHLERGMNNLPNYSPSGAANKPYLLPKPTAPVKGNPEGGVIVNSVATPVPNRVVVGENAKPVENSKPSPVIKSVSSKGHHLNPQFIDPPEEFQFRSNKRSRKARRVLPADSQKKVARRPWKEVKCSVHLRALIYAMPPPPESEAVEPIVIDDD